jgi:hypothetical protein
VSFRTDLLATVEGVRALRGPAGLDIQTVTVTIVRRTWSGGRRGAGTATVAVLTALPAHTKVREISQKLVASTGGRFELGDLRVGPITPSFTGGGFTPAELAPVGTQGQEIVYVLAGAITGDYTAVDVDTAKAFSYFLTLRRTSP